MTPAAIGPVVAIPAGLTFDEARLVLERAARGEIDAPRAAAEAKAAEDVEERTRRLPEGTLKATIRAMDAITEFVNLIEEAVKAADRGPYFGEASNLLLNELTERRMILALALNREPLGDPEGSM